MAHKILIVDDDASLVRLLQSLLEKNGYTVVTAYDGLDALVKVKQHNPDLVILDIMMPEINGYDVCYQLRFNPEFSKVPIVLLTVREQELDEEVSRRVNIEYCPKPLNFDLLLKKITSLLP